MLTKQKQAAGYEALHAHEPYLSTTVEDDKIVQSWTCGECLTDFVNYKAGDDHLVEEIAKAVNPTVSEIANALTVVLGGLLPFWGGKDYAEAAERLLAVVRAEK